MALDRRDALSILRRDAGGAALVGVGAAGVCLAFYTLNHGFFLVDDGQTASLPHLLALGRGWLAGTPLQITGSWYAGETPVGVWSPPLAAVAALAVAGGWTIQGAAAAFAAVHEAVLAAGVFMLARRIGLPASAALLAAVIGAFNGYVFVWGARDWIGDLACFAWLPWFWWALLRPGSALASATLAGLALALMLSVIWPFTVVMAAVLTGALALQALLTERHPAAVVRYAGAWVIGLGLAAPTLLPWLALLGASHRAATGLIADQTWQVPLAALPGLVLPAVHADWQIFAGGARKPAHELAGALVPLAAILAAMIARGRQWPRDHAVPVGLLVLFFVACLAPGFWNFRWPFRWLPMMHLTLALVGGVALAAAPRRGAIGPGLVAFGLVGLTWVAMGSLGGDASALLWATGLSYLVLTGLWALAEHLRPAHALTRWLPAAVALGTLGVTYLLLPLERPSQGKWRVEEAIREAAPFDPARTYLLLTTPAEQLEAAERGWPLTVMRLGNLPMLAGLRTLNGYTNGGPPGLEQVFNMRHAGTVSPRAADHVLTREMGPAGWLRQLGVDGLVVGPARAQRALPAGWQRVHTGPDGDLWHRLGPPSPLFQSLAGVRTTRTAPAAAEAVFAPRAQAAPAVVVDPVADDGTERPYGSVVLTAPWAQGTDRLGVDVRVAADRPALVCVSRPYFRGWRAHLGTRELDTYALNGIQLAVELPAGAQGRLALTYRPRSFVVGAWVAAATGAGLGLLWLLRRRAGRVAKETPTG